MYVNKSGDKFCSKMVGLCISHTNLDPRFELFIQCSVFNHKLIYWALKSIMCTSLWIFYITYKESKLKSSGIGSDRSITSMYEFRIWSLLV